MADQTTVVVPLEVATSPALPSQLEKATQRASNILHKLARAVERRAREIEDEMASGSLSPERAVELMHAVEKLERSYRAMAAKFANLL
jgi:hypothetical protein